MLKKFCIRIDQEDRQDKPGKSVQQKINVWISMSGHTTPYWLLEDEWVGDRQTRRKNLGPNFMEGGDELSLYSLHIYCTR